MQNTCFPGTVNNTTFSNLWKFDIVFLQNRIITHSFEVIIITFCVLWQHVACSLPAWRSVGRSEVFVWICSGCFHCYDSGMKTDTPLVIRSFVFTTCGRCRKDYGNRFNTLFSLQLSNICRETYWNVESSLVLNCFFFCIDWLWNFGIVSYFRFIQKIKKGCSFLKDH